MVRKRIYISLGGMGKESQQCVWRHVQVAQSGSHSVTSEEVKGQTSCANPEIVSMPVEDVNMI